MVVSISELVAVRQKSVTLEKDYIKAQKVLQANLHLIKQTDNRVVDFNTLKLKASSCFEEE